jgi:molybdate transport system substrate-binding protein
LETLHIFSAGAAQAVVARLVREFQQKNACAVEASYGAVQSMKARIVAGEPADVIVLTDALIDELTTRELVVPGSRADLGSVGTAIAVRAGTPLPGVGDAETLRLTLLGATRVYCPDPAAATAGKVLLRVLERLGIFEQLRPRLVYCASGYQAMTELACGVGANEIGVMQITEIVANAEVALAGPMPGALQSQAIYSAGLAANSRSPERAREFITQLLAGRDTLRAAGFGDCEAAATPHKEI